MLHSPIAQITTVATAVVAVFALVRGRWPERVGACVIALDCAGTILFQDHQPHHHLQTVWLALDSVQAAVFLAMAASTRRAWTLWAGAFAILLVLTHLTFMLSAGFGQWSYLTVIYIWGVGLLATLALGTGVEGRGPAGALFGMSDVGRSLMAAHPSTPSAKARRRS